MLYAKFCSNWPYGSGDDDVLIPVLLLSPLELDKKNLNPTNPKMFCANLWLELAEWFWRSEQL